MYSKAKYSSVTILNTKLIPFLISIIFISWSSKLDAQRQEFFTANGKDVNIGTFNRQVIYMMDEMGVPGMSLAIIDNNQIVFNNAYGIKRQGDNKKVNKKTVFDGCSLSKSFLAFVVYQLVDEGKLDLDKPMYQYLEYERLEYDSRYKLITPRMILSHSSGIENWEEDNKSDTLEILSNPGEKYVYSGEGYEYLAKVVELRLNQSYEEYVNERVIKPLKLKNTHLKYSQNSSNPFHKDSPWNYAVGHQVFGQQRIYKNTNTFPAAGNHFTAEDYAKLILAIFDKTHLTSNRINDILEPIVKSSKTSSVFYGPGFEVSYSNNDTIISHGGTKPGYKNLMFYSVAKKRGFVYMTNSERGYPMAAKLCDMTVGLNIDSFVESISHIYEQYPSPVFSLLKIYDEKGYDAMFAELENLKSERKIRVNTLNVLSLFFKVGGEEKISKKLLEENILLYPNSSLAYARLGEHYLEMNDIDLAIKNFTKAKELKFSLWEIEAYLKECKKRLADAERRRNYFVSINENKETTIQAENYNTMRGCKLQSTSDIGGDKHVGFIDTDDWMDYKVNVSTTGTYSVSFRIASLNGGGQIQLRFGTKVLAMVDVPSTNGWSNWTTLTTNVHLSAGSQTLTLYASVGGFTVNWIHLSPMQLTNK